MADTDTLWRCAFEAASRSASCRQNVGVIFVSPPSFAENRYGIALLLRPDHAGVHDHPW